uniref:Uncharacterized protein n=1 Tax=Romanomermis culicivorax TaxID=13658 RepID=A0A915KW04_ROMCU
MLQHSECISQTQKNILLDKYACIIKEHDAKIEEYNSYIKALQEKNKDYRRKKGQYNHINYVKQKLIRSCGQLVCLGFNSVRQVRLNEEAKWPRANLRNGAYLCLTIDQLKFLDASTYAAPGFSLDTFMQAYRAKLTKAKFPYEYIDSFTKLDEQQLLPIERFFTCLRKEHISHKDASDAKLGMDAKLGQTSSWEWMPC